MSSNKGITLINILGLSSGLAICLLILFYVNDELRFDRHNTRLDRIFRVNTDLKIVDSFTSWANAAPQVAIAMQNAFPQVA
jgi:putative ABC transport system permease protein